jgi:predicted  nucleic acid-binding Zn-ribbon protein
VAEGWFAVVTAAAQDQWRLLDVQGHDTRLAQIAHRQKSMPEHAEIAQLETRLAAIDAELVVARTTATDLGRELTKAENDVEQVRTRAARNRARLDSGQGSAKDLQGLQHELDSLANRQSVLEDVELEIMERQEAAAAAVDTAKAEYDQVAAQLAEVIARRDRALQALEAEANTERQARESAAAGVPKALITLYEKIREQSDGVGAARLYQRRCEGCRLSVPPNDLNTIRSAPADEVIRCEECRRILVRTAESGL